MSLANPDECPHPMQRSETVVENGVRLLGFRRCKRCGIEVNEGRERTMRISPRVTVGINQCVQISELVGWPSYGRFKYAERQPSGRTVAAVLTPDGWRFVMPNRLKTASEVKCSKPSDG